MENTTQVESNLEEQISAGNHAEEVVENTSPPETPKKKRRKKKIEVSATKDTRCPACVLGQDLAKGEGTHILGTDEHPIPSATQIVEKAVKQPRRIMAKELRGAQNFAEKMLPKKIAEKAKLMSEIARCEAEIQEYTRVVQALGGQAPVGLPSVPYIAQSPVYQPISPQSYTPEANSQMNPSDPLSGMRIASIPAILQGSVPTIDDKGWV